MNNQIDHSSRDLSALHDEREKEMRTEEFKSKYTCILPYRVTFIAWREVKDPDGIYESEHEPYEDHKGRYVELEVDHPDWVGDNWHTPLYELAKKLTVDDLVESDKAISSPATLRTNTNE